ncbi:MAG: pyruvate kinase alpha/beta domain-containing protein [Anaerolineae bacterium]
MTSFKSETTYFEHPGKANTDTALRLAHQRARTLGIDTLLIATTTGYTAVRATEILSDDVEIVAVTHSTGFHKPDMQELKAERQAALEAAGVRILTCQHAFGGVGRAVRKQLGTYQTEEIIAYTLRRFGEGMKVVAEIALMAADAGLVSVQAPLVAVAGTGRGADTAVVLQPTNAQTFFDLQFMEIICMPAPGHPAF